MNSTELRDVESVFNAFCSCIDVVDANLATSHRNVKKFSAKELLTKAALFTFEASTCDRVFTLARERGNSVPVSETPLPFDNVVLADNLGVVHIHDMTETDDDVVLRRMDVMVYLRHLHTADGWIAMTTGVDYINAAKVNETGADIFSIDPRSNRDTNILRLSGPLVVVAGECAGRRVTAHALPDNIRPATREDELPANPTSADVAAFMLRDFITSVTSAMEQLYYVNLPRHHVIEQCPHHVIKNAERIARQAKTKVPRFGDRVRYILVEPERVAQIRPAKTADAEGTHASPVPHMRAGYSKVLRAERFKKKRWAVVHVRPTWVGDEEWDHGNVRFRVIAPGAKL